MNPEDANEVKMRIEDEKISSGREAWLSSGRAPAESLRGTCRYANINPHFSPPEEIYRNVVKTKSSKGGLQIIKMEI